MALKGSRNTKICYFPNSGTSEIVFLYLKLMFPTVATSFFFCTVYVTKEPNGQPFLFMWAVVPLQLVLKCLGTEIYIGFLRVQIVAYDFPAPSHWFFMDEKIRNICTWELRDAENQIGRWDKERREDSQKGREKGKPQIQPGGILQEDTLTMHLFKIAPSYFGPFLKQTAYYSTTHGSVSRFIERKEKIFYW